MSRWIELGAGRRRTWALAVLLVGTGVAAAWLWQAGHEAPAGRAGAYEVSVVAPDGSLWWNGTVTVPAPATALLATQEAARLGGFGLDVQQQAQGAYVRGIGPFSETASGGWNYCVDQGHGYAWAGLSADRWGLQPGQKVQWRWAEGGSEVC